MYDSQIKLAAPDRRYTVDEPSEEVMRRVRRGLGGTAMVLLNITLADIYNGELPIPHDIANREIEFSIDFAARTHSGGLRVNGQTENSGSNNIVVNIPGDLSETSTLRLLDIERHKKDIEDSL